MSGKKLNTPEERNLLLGRRAFPPFAALRAFEAVGRLGGVRRASSQLGVDHAVVSRHVRTLEENLGVALFRRSRSSLVLTEIGRTYHDRVSAALLDLALATSELDAHEDRRKLRVWCVPGFAIQWLADQLAQFEALHPDIEVELRPTDNAADLLMDEADIDIRFYGDDWLPTPGGRGLRHVELARPSVMAVASPAFAERLNRLGSALALAEEPLLHEEHHEQWRLWLQRNGVEPAGELRGPLLWHAHHAIAASRMGRGVALASTYLISNDLARGELVEVRLPGTEPVVIGAYYLVTRADRWSMPAITKLRRFLSARAAR